MQPVPKSNDELIGEVFLNEAIAKCLYALDEPHGEDTRITLTTEECHALLASLPHHTVNNACEVRHKHSHGSRSKYVHRVYKLAGAGARGVDRISKVRHTERGDIESLLLERRRKERGVSGL